MNVHWTFRHCACAQKSEARDYFHRKLPRLDRILRRYPAEQRQLALTLDHNPPHHAWELRAVLHLPTGILVTGAEAPDLRNVIDEVVDELVRQIQRHKAEVRKEHARRRRQRQRTDQRAALPYLQADVDSRRAPDFFMLLKPFLKSLRDHAQRELRILELEGSIPSGEVTADDLTDDVLVTAWETFPQRPQHAPIDVWLLRILHERLNKLQECYGDIKLSTPVEDATVEEAEADLDDLHFWLCQALEPAIPLTLEDVITDEGLSDWWHALETKDQYDQLMAALKRLPKHERQAFMLSEVEGFDLSEIAMVLDRSEDQVAADIARARSALQEMVLNTGIAQGKDECRVHYDRSEMA